MKRLLFGVLALGSSVSWGGGGGINPRLGTTFDKRSAANELGTVTQVGATVLPLTAFIDDGHGGWALDGATFAEKGVALYASLTGGGWNGDLSGNTNAVSSSGTETLSHETASDWTLSLRAKVGHAPDQILWFLRYGEAGVGTYLRTVANASGGLDLSLEWSGNKSYPPHANVILENVDTADFHHYVVSASRTDGLKLFVDGEQKWNAQTILAYSDTEGQATQARNLYAKSYNSLWLGCVDQKENVGTGDWTTVYDDVRFYSTNNTEDSSVPTAAEIAALTETLKAERVLPLPSARLSFSFDDRTLTDTAGVVEPEGTDASARRMFRKNDRGGHSLDAARLSDGQGVCLFQHANVWDASQPLLGNASSANRSFALSFVAKLAPVGGAAVCFVRCGGEGAGLALYTTLNEAGGTDLALTWLGSSERLAYPNVLAKDVDTENYHHYVLTCSNLTSTRQIRLWIDCRPVDLLTDSMVKFYSADGSTTEIASRNAVNGGYSGLYLAAVRGAKRACNVPNGTRFGDVRFFAGDDFTDAFGPVAIDAEGIEALYRHLMPYADAPRTGALVIIR